MRPTMIALAITLAALACAQDAVLLNNCENLDTVVIGSKPVRHDTKTIHTEGPYVSEGHGSLHMYMESPPDPTGSVYLNWMMPIPETDLTKNAITFDGWTAFPETTKALYVRTYDADGRCTGSWRSWNGLLKPEKITFTCILGETHEGLEWEKGYDIPGDATKTTQVQFYTGTRAKSAKFDMFLDNIQSHPAEVTFEGAEVKGAVARATETGEAFSRVETLAGTPEGGGQAAATDDAAVRAPIMVWGAESLEGIKGDMGADQPGAVFELNTDKACISEGNASLKLAGVSPTPRTGNSYMAVRVPVEPFDMTDRALALDVWSTEPANTKALYVRGYNAEGKCVMSWNTWSADVSEQKTTVTLIPGMSKGMLAWDAGAVEAEDRTAVTQLRIYTGTSPEATPFNMYVDNVQAVHNVMRSFNDVTQAKKLYPDTALVAAGKAQAVIVTPAGEPWEPLAREIAGAVQQATGAELQVTLVDDITDEQMQATNAIVLGSIVDNMRLLYPYSHNLIFTDANFPGPDGFDLRTVHDPWGTGKNLICIGATTAEGARAGVDAFKAHVAQGNELVIPQLLEVKLTGPALASYGKAFRDAPDEKWASDQRDRCESHLRTAGTRGLFSMAAGIGETYAITRQPAYAQMFVWMIKRTYENYLSDPKTYGGPWGMDSDFHIYEVIPAWDAVEQCPGLTDAERLEVSKILFRWVSELGPQKSARASSKSIRFNHQTFPALGCLFAGQYFSRYYDAAEGFDWIEVADGTFQFQLDAFKPHCDCNSYQWLTLRHVIDYCRARPDLKYFENDNIRRNADYAILTMNNLGYQVAYGDIGGWGPMGGEMPILRAAEWHYRDGRAQWALNKKHAAGARQAFSDFAVNTPEESEPVDLTGTKLWPLDEMWYNSFGGKDVVAFDKAVDKISFRNGFNPDDQYLLLDGLSVGGHCHMDGNSVLQWTENGRVWLCDADYIKSLPKYHNGVLILRDGQSARMPGYCELENIADLPSAGFSRTVTRNYAGVDWHRNLIWLKDRLFVCVDQMQANEPSSYSFRAVWQTIGDVSLDGAKMAVEQKGQNAAITMSQDMHCLLNNDPDTGKNWGSYRFANEPIVRVYQGILDADLQAGAQANLFTALHASGETPSEVKLTRLSDTVAYIEGAGSPIMLAVADAAGTVTIPAALRAKAALLVMTTERMYGVGVTEVEFMGQKRVFEQPMDFEADLKSGKATLIAPSMTTATATPTAATAEFSITASPEDITSLMRAVVNAATPPAAAGAAQADIPKMTGLFTYAITPEAYLLTNNATSPERVPALEQVTCTPEPIETNVFSGAPGTNSIENIFNGGIEATGDATMWDDDREVTINLRLKGSYEIEKMALKAWFVTSSSKDKTFQIGRLRLLGSNDGFAADTRTLVDVTDTEMHGNWGDPAHEPHVYTFEGINAAARDLRLIITPREGTGTYLAELELWGDGEGLEQLRAAADPTGASTYAFRSLHCADLDNDGIDETLAGCDDGTVYCLKPDGTVQWELDTGGAVTSVNTVDFNGDGRLAVIAGTMGSQVLAIDSQGKELWRHDIEYYKRTPYVRTVFPADLTGDGKQCVIAGSDNWRYHALDATGRKLWHQESVHGSTAGCAVDLTRDGKQEVVCGTEYYWWPAAKPDTGERLWGYGTKGGPGCNAVAAGDVNGDGNNEVVFGGADTLLQVVSNEGKLIWSLNTGDEVTSVSCADVNADGKAEILATSLSFNVYCVDGEGKLIWRTGLPNQLRCSVVYDNGDGMRVAAGCDDGNVYLLDASDGQVLAAMATGARLIDLAAGKLVAGAGMQLVASSEDGAVRAMKVE